MKTEKRGGNTANVSNIVDDYIANDQGAYYYWTERTREAMQDTEFPVERMQCLLRDFVREALDMVEEQSLMDDAEAVADLPLSWILRVVLETTDWTPLAESLINSIEEGA